MQFFFKLQNIKLNVIYKYNLYIGETRALNALSDYNNAYTY